MSKKSDASEEAKWVAAQKALELSDSLGSFLGKIVGPSAFALGGLLGDQLKSWRSANLTRIAEKWRAKIEEQNIPADAIKLLPFQDSFLLIEAASMEQDDYVSDLWAKLIFSATTSKTENHILKLHIDILKSLNGLDARTLMAVFERMRGNGNEQISSLMSDESVTGENLRVTLQNLQRIGVLTQSFTEFEILGHSTFEKWAATITSENLLDEFKNVTTKIISELTSLTGSPMNDMRLESCHFEGLLENHALTRIGWDLFFKLYEQD